MEAEKLRLNPMDALPSIRIKRADFDPVKMSIPSDVRGTYIESLQVGGKTLPVAYDLVAYRIDPLSYGGAPLPKEFFSLV